MTMYGQYDVRLIELHVPSQLLSAAAVTYRRFSINAQHSSLDFSSFRNAVFFPQLFSIFNVLFVHFIDTIFRSYICDIISFQQFINLSHVIENMFDFKMLNRINIR
jgi:hypothetical protein